LYPEDEYSIFFVPLQEPSCDFKFILELIWNLIFDVNLAGRLFCFSIQEATLDLSQKI
jgi:hypothetical protein